MTKIRLLSVVLGIFALVHAIAMLWCISGGLAARESDIAAFHAVASPLKDKADITDAGMTALQQNVEKRSAVHATVMFTYAVVHGLTAVAFGVASIAVYRKSRVDVSKTSAW